jgi:tetratricopeptide (TPR) repeat protein
LARSGDPFFRAEGAWGLRQYQSANDEFRAAYDAHKDSALVRAEWASLFLDRFNPAEANKLFEESASVDERYAPAYLGLARIAALGYNKKAVDLAHKAIELDPKFVEAHEFLAYLALEDSNPELAAKEAQAALDLSREALDAMAVLASIDWLNGKQETEWTARVLKINPVYGEAYATGAHFFVINRRYEDGIRLYREALKLNPDLNGARSELGINLMRLGDNDEARRQLERCYQSGYRNAETVNSLRFLDRLPDYETFRSGNSVLVVSKKEAPLLKLYIQPELERAVATYEKKYKMKLPGPVRLEVYPNHDDFIVRTLGLPGQGGLLGVTFGLVVAMDSPSARPPGDFLWASTMWHELSHVYVVTATHHLVPRWFTEGLSVHEEHTAEADWGDRMTPEIVNALHEKRLLPVMQLERGFVRPDYPTQVLVSYYQAGKICDFIAEKWGDDTILGMIHSFADRKTTAEAIQENLHESPEAFDKEFLAWLDGRTHNTVAHFDDWKRSMQASQDGQQKGQNDVSIRTQEAIRDFYPDYIGNNSAYEVLADFYLSQNKKAEAIQQLERYRDLGGHKIAILKKLANLEQETNRQKEAERTLTKLNYIYLEDEESHHKLGTLRLTLGDAEGAIREYQAVIALHPGDVAQSHFELAKALQAARRTKEAKDEVLLALEAAPGFKQAQQLLLQLSQ